MSKERKIVIIGGVALGASAAARLRRLNESDQIIMFERDEFVSFANCGLPYYIGDVIKERDNLIVQTKEGLASRFNLDVRNFSEVTSIDRNKKEVTVVDHKNNKTYQESYDIAILAPGASPIIPPIKGYESAKNLFKLRNIPDTDAIKSYVNTNNVKKAVVVGAGFIGIEMAENLNHLGIEVTVLDLANQVMTLFDEEMAKLIENNLTRSGVNFKLKTSIDTIENNGTKLILTDQTTLETDMIIMAIGVLPETKLAKDAGLEIGETGAIKVNQFMQTSDPSIYAGGDAIQVNNFITQNPTKVPLAWPANRQGRLIADHINNIETPYNGTLGSAVIKVNDFVAATTGLNERVARQAYPNVEVLHVHRSNHASYYPNSSTITLKVIFDKDTHKVLGAQAYGQDGTEKRIDVIATAIKFNATIEQLSDLELTYAPPFSSAKDPVNIAGYVGQNILENRYTPFFISDLETIIANKKQLIDVRSTHEFELGTIENAINIDVDSLRTNLDKIDFDQDVYLFCQVGLRGFIASQILRNNGFKKQIYNLSGGYKLFADNKSTAPRNN